MKVIFELRPDERAVGICNYRDCIILATDQRVYRITNADCDEEMCTEIIDHSRF